MLIVSLYKPDGPIAHHEVHAAFMIAAEIHLACLASATQGVRAAGHVGRTGAAGTPTWRNFATSFW